MSKLAAQLGMTPSVCAGSVLRILMSPSVDRETYEEMRLILMRAFHARLTQAELINAAQEAIDAMADLPCEPKKERLRAAIDAALKEPT